MASRQDSSVPSWDEFDIDHQELDYEEEDPVCEPSTLELGPGLPPEFSTADQRSSFIRSNPVNDFVISTTESDNLLNDPEDPHQRRAAATPKQRVIGPEMPPDLRKEDSFNLPSITSTSDFQRPCSSKQAAVIGPSLPFNFLISTSSDRSPSVIESEDVISLPPDEPSRQTKKTTQQEGGSSGSGLSSSFLPTVSTSVNGLFAENSKNNTKKSHSLIGPALPPDFCDSTSESGFVDEPSTSSGLNRTIGPALRTNSSAVESNGSKRSNGDMTQRKLSSNGGGNHHVMELPLDDDDSNSNFVSGSEDYVPVSAGHAVNIKATCPDTEIPCATDGNDPSVQNEAEDDDEVVGPVLPPAFKNAGEEDADYFSRFVEYETRKSEGGSRGGLKREEWMTELPAKLKQSYGLTAKNAFARASGFDSSSGNNAWTDVNGRPSTSKASTSKVSNVVSSSKEIRLTTSDSTKEEKRESLLDFHQRKRKLNDNEASSSSDGSSRRPFNRDTDMEVRGLSSMSSEEAKTRLGNLSSRFASGS